MSNVVDLLVSAGMRPVEAEQKSALFESCEANLDGSPDARWFVPGRIEVLGKHTDYAGGRSLLCAAERGMCVAAKARADDKTVIRDVVSEQQCTVSFSDTSSEVLTGWALYPMTVARRLARNLPGIDVGADIVFASDVPRASGMSSSSVLVTAIFTVLSHFNHLRQRPEYIANIRSTEDLAGYLGCIENGETFRGFEGDRGVGTFGGSEDHTAILNCRAGELAQYSFCPVRFEGTVKLPSDLIFVIGSSGVTAPKTGSAKESYNAVSRRARAVLELWNRETGATCKSLGEAVANSTDAPELIRCMLANSVYSEFPAESLVRRFDQFLLESEEIIPGAAASLEQGDLLQFGELVAQSQAAAELGLENQVPETKGLVRNARDLGAYAASAFGAGFGGSVWALVDREEAETFATEWRAMYLREFPRHSRHCRFFLTAAGPGLVSFQ